MKTLVTGAKAVDFAWDVFALWGLRRGPEPCRASESPRPAPRPANSRLEKRAMRLMGWPPMPSWREESARFRAEHPDG